MAQSVQCDSVGHTRLVRDLLGSDDAELCGVIFCKEVVQRGTSASQSQPSFSGFTCRWFLSAKGSAAVFVDHRQRRMDLLQFGFRPDAQHTALMLKLVIQLHSQHDAGIFVALHF